VEFVGPLYTDLRSASSGVLNGVKFQVVLRQASDSFRIFCLEKGENYKIEITDISLHVPMSVVTPSVFAEMGLHLQSKPSFINYRRIMVTKDAIPKRAQSFTKERLFSGVI
jgi:hypothetical protein